MIKVFQQHIALVKARNFFTEEDAKKMRLLVVLQEVAVLLHQHLQAHFRIRKDRVLQYFCSSVF